MVLVTLMNDRQKKILDAAKPIVKQLAQELKPAYNEELVPSTEQILSGLTLERGPDRKFEIPCGASVYTKDKMGWIGLPVFQAVLSHKDGSYQFEIVKNLSVDSGLSNHYMEQLNKVAAEA